MQDRDRYITCIPEGFVWEALKVMRPAPIDVREYESQGRHPYFSFPIYVRIVMATHTPLCTFWNCNDCSCRTLDMAGNAIATSGRTCAARNRRSTARRVFPSSVIVNPVPKWLRLRRPLLSLPSSPLWPTSTTDSPNGRLLLVSPTREPWRILQKRSSVSRNLPCIITAPPPVLLFPPDVSFHMCFTRRNLA